MLRLNGWRVGAPALNGRPLYEPSDFDIGGRAPKVRNGTMRSISSRSCAAEPAKCLSPGIPVHSLSFWFNIR
jgi:hypothetical protein